MLSNRNNSRLTRYHTSKIATIRDEDQPGTNDTIVVTNALSATATNHEQTNIIDTDKVTRGASHVTICKLSHLEMITNRRPVTYMTHHHHHHDVPWSCFINSNKTSQRTTKWHWVTCQFWVFLSWLSILGFDAPTVTGLIVRTIDKDIVS